MLCTCTLIQKWDSVRSLNFTLERVAVYKTNMTLLFLLEYPSPVDVQQRTEGKSEGYVLPMQNYAVCVESGGEL